MQLAALEARRAELYAQLSEVGRLPAGVAQRGLPQVREAELRVRGAGSSRSWAAVEPDAEGGRADADGAPEAGAGAGQGPREIAEYQRFRDLAGQVAEVNEEICRLRPVLPGEDGGRPSRAGRGKRGLRAALAREKAAELGRLAAEAARALGCGDAGAGGGRAVLRAGLLRLGAGMLGELLSADRGYRGPRVPLRERARGRVRRPTGTRSSTPSSARSPLTRAWYHCAACGHGLAPRDAELGVAGTSMSPGLAAMNDLAAAAGPFAGAARPAGGAGRGPAHRQAGRARRRGQRRRRRGRRPRTGPALIAARKLVPLPPVAAAGQALRRHRRHRRPHDLQGDRRPGGQGRGRPGPHPRGQARRLLHPGQARRGRLPGPRPGLHQRHRHLRARRRVRGAS